MKKRFLALFLVMTFVMSISASSFANTGCDRKFSLSPGSSTYMILMKEDMDEDDDYLGVAVVYSSGSNFNCKLEVFDARSGELLETRYPRVKSSYTVMNNIVDHNRSIKLKLTNIGDSRIKGNMVAIVK